MRARASPRVAWFRVRSGPGWAWSGRCGECADAGEDFVEQLVAGWQAQGERAGVVDQPGRDADQPVPQAGLPKITGT